MDPGLIPVTDNAEMRSWLHRNQGVTDKVNFACSLALSALDFSLVLGYLLWLYLDYQRKSIHSFFIAHWPLYALSLSQIQGVISRKLNPELTLKDWECSMHRLALSFRELRQPDLLFILLVLSAFLSDHLIQGRKEVLTALRIDWILWSLRGEEGRSQFLQGSGMWAGNYLFRLSAVLNNEIYVADLISYWCMSYNNNIAHMSWF